MLVTIVAVVFLFGTAWYLLRDSAPTVSALTSKSISTSVGKSAQSGQGSKNTVNGPRVTFYFASQRGTAQEFAETLTKQGKLRGLNSVSFDLENFRQSALLYLCYICP